MALSPRALFATQRHYHLIKIRLTQHCLPTGPQQFRTIPLQRKGIQGELWLSYVSNVSLGTGSFLPPEQKPTSFVTCSQTLKQPRCSQIIKMPTGAQQHSRTSVRAELSVFPSGFVFAHIQQDLLAICLLTGTAKAVVSRLCPLPNTHDRCYVFKGLQKHKITAAPYLLIKLVIKKPVTFPIFVCATPLCLSAAFNV